MARQPKKITIKLTKEQQELLAKATKGNFTTATFSFETGEIEAPKHEVTCSLRRVARANKSK